MVVLCLNLMKGLRQKELQQSQWEGLLEALEIKGLCFNLEKFKLSKGYLLLLTFLSVLLLHINFQSTYFEQSSFALLPFIQTYLKLSLTQLNQQSFSKVVHLLRNIVIFICSYYFSNFILKQLTQSQLKLVQ
jgi:uncharacterized membrane protein YccF (DUF307 family)